MRGRHALVLAVAIGLIRAHPAAGAIEIQARVARQALAVGETTTLEVSVRGASGPIAEPEVTVPPGIDVLGTGRMQNFSWVNGRMSGETVFRYEIAPNAGGKFILGPIRVRVGGQLYQSPAIEITVSAAPTRVGDTGEGPASLVADVSPAEPYVGQPVILRVRLIQRSPLAEDPQYTPPATPGFWSERFSDPESYYAAQGAQRVLVTETRARLYPLASGEASVGEAAATVVLATPGQFADPLQWFGGRVPRRELSLRSAPVRVRVRPLPGGAPAGFDGAVGEFSVSFSADRARTSQDVPVTIRLEVRGRGNLPLLHTPVIADRDVEPFAGTVEDSLGPPGSSGSGRRRFQWTALPRHPGRIVIEAPAFAWFDPGASVYRRAAPAPIVIEVGPPLFAGNDAPEAFPAVFADHPLDPMARPAEAWAWGVAGLALGFSLALWRRSRRAPPDAADRARQREWLRAVGLARGPDFWHAAEQASAFLEGRGIAVAGLRREISAARYGGTAVDGEAVRRRLIEELGRALPARPPAWPLQAAAVALSLSAIALAVLLGPQPGGTREVIEARRADERARAGELDPARRAWLSLWQRGARSPGLAARLAWAEARVGAVGPASAWVLRGERAEPRDPSLSWVRDRVREAGGLSGDAGAHLPLRRLEWAALALLFGFAAVASWPRRLPASAAVALALGCAAVAPAQSWIRERDPVGVVAESTTLSGPGLEMGAGQVVRVLGRSGERVRVAAGRDIVGWLPARALIVVGTAS
jgi:hypothetical protein